MLYLVMQPTQHMARRLGMIILHELGIDARQLRKAALIETLEEEATLIAAVFGENLGSSLDIVFLLKTLCQDLTPTLKLGLKGFSAEHGRGDNPGTSEVTTL